MNRIVAGAFFIVTTASILAASQNAVVAPSVSLASQEPRYVLSVDVELVNIAATVIDDGGRYVDGLGAADFQVLEDGRQQDISFFSHDTRVPISLGVLIDVSGSVQEKVRQGLQTVRGLASTLSSEDEMFVITFDSRVQVKQRFTHDAEEIERSLHDVHAHGETAVYDAIAAGLHEMEGAKHRRRILLLVSDGFDTRSKTSATQAEELLKRSGVPLYALGIDDDDADAPARRRPRYHIYEYMLNKLSNAGGGRLIRMYTGRNYDLVNLSESLLGELHQQYTMGYYPSMGPDDDRSRNVEIRVMKPGARIVSEELLLQRR
jgi:Ca-activated chloride channel family protein